MPKLNKPRLAHMPDEGAARELLSAHDIAPAEVQEVHHFSDGSMSVIIQRGEDRWNHGFEFDPALTAELSLAFKAVGITVIRDEG